jgi:hypothetical protein
MTRGFLGVGLAVTLVWAAACSSDDKKKTTADGGCSDSGCPRPTNKICNEDSECSEPANNGCSGCPERFSRCERITTTTIGTCTKACTSDVECPSAHSCQEGPSIGLDPSCIATCNGTSCPAQHSCSTNSMGLSICIPNAWNTL